MLQVELVFSGEGTFTVTFHASEPVAVMFGLSRSLHEASAEGVAAQPSPVEEAGVMWELRLRSRPKAGSALGESRVK